MPAAPATIPALVPMPASLDPGEGVFRLGRNIEIVMESSDDGVRRAADLLAASLSTATGRDVAVRNGKGRVRPGQIVLSVDQAFSPGGEAYELRIDSDFVRLRAAGPAGLFYGVQTLRQMLPPEGGSPSTGRRMVLPCLRIHDQPRFRWRGLMLDLSRTFLSLDYLKRCLDQMAWYKLNVVHLHLTDDQGWRLEIKKYPKLTSIASRFDERFGGGGGYYTQEEMRGLIAYARERNITVVPEVELPGHSLEVLTAYPELACPIQHPQVLEIAPFFDGSQIFSHPLCAGNEKTYRMLEDIFAEVIDLFPSEFIHLGGDEVSKTAWKECPRCQARMRAEGLKNENELQSYIIKRMVKFISGKGRRAIGWDEILEGGLAPGAAVMSWRGVKGGIAAADLGHDVVMTPNTNCYLDYTYLTLPVERVYSYDPVPAELNRTLSPHVLGVQANMWTHIATTERAIDYQLYPRLLALAEVAWSPAQARNWASFQDRLRAHSKRLRLLGIHRFDADENATARRAGDWDARSVEGNAPHVLEWDVSPMISGPGEYLIQVRHEAGRKAVFVRSLVLLEDGREISRQTLPGLLAPPQSIEVGWLDLARVKPGARYTLRVGIRGVRDNDVSGSVWVVSPPGGRPEAN